MYSTKQQINDQKAVCMYSNQQVMKKLVSLYSIKSARNQKKFVCKHIIRQNMYVCIVISK